ncbi:hypothetical protein CC78DRAFT_589718 [Lojkania enalia]|uniref:Uncharacterized protein n=1 Tax=Lojkania enalia TaxID=147567 RepID=A0A9P4K6L2_9PLEO|nr:hypothetical protein CC78DRAFT_589718 [Didymosphaeria enalia]
MNFSGILTEAETGVGLDPPKKVKAQNISVQPPISPTPNRASSPLLTTLRTTREPRLAPNGRKLAGRGPRTKHNAPGVVPAVHAALSEPVALGNRQKCGADGGDEDTPKMQKVDYNNDINASDQPCFEFDSFPRADNADKIFKFETLFGDEFDPDESSDLEREGRPQPRVDISLTEDEKKLLYRMKSYKKSKESKIGVVDGTFNMQQEHVGIWTEENFEKFSQDVKAGLHEDELFGFGNDNEDDDDKPFEGYVSGSYEFDGELEDDDDDAGETGPVAEEDFTTGGIHTNQAKTSRQDAHDEEHSVLQADEVTSTKHGKDEGMKVDKPLKCAEPVADMPSRERKLSTTIVFERPESGKAKKQCLQEDGDDVSSYEKERDAFQEKRDISASDTPPETTESMPQDEEQTFTPEPKDLRLDISDRTPVGLELDVDDTDFPRDTVENIEDRDDHDLGFLFGDDKNDEKTFKKEPVVKELVDGSLKSSNGDDDREEKTKKCNVVSESKGISKDIDMSDLDDEDLPSVGFTSDVKNTNGPEGTPTSKAEEKSTEPSNESEKRGADDDGVRPKDLFGYTSCGDGIKLEDKEVGNLLKSDWLGEKHSLNSMDEQVFSVTSHIEGSHQDAKPGRDEVPCIEEEAKKVKQLRTPTPTPLSRKRKARAPPRNPRPKRSKICHAEDIAEPKTPLENWWENDDPDFREKETTLPKYRGPIQYSRIRVARKVPKTEKDKEPATGTANLQKVLKSKKNRDSMRMVGPKLTAEQIKSRQDDKKKKAEEIKERKEEKKRNALEEDFANVFGEYEE